MRDAGRRSDYGRGERWTALDAIAGNVGSGRNHGRSERGSHEACDRWETLGAGGIIVGIECGRSQRASRETAAREGSPIEPNAVAGVIANDVRSRGDDGGRQIGSFAIGTHALRRRRSGIGLDGQQIGYGFARRGKLEVWRVDDFGYERSVRGLCEWSGCGDELQSPPARPVVPASAPPRSSVRGQFVATVIDHVVTGESGRDVGPHLIDLDLNGNYGEDHEQLRRYRRES